MPSQAETNPDEPKRSALPVSESLDKSAVPTATTEPGMFRELTLRLAEPGRCLVTTFSQCRLSVFFIICSDRNSVDAPGRDVRAAERLPAGEFAESTHFQVIPHSGSRCVSAKNQLSQPGVNTKSAPAAVDRRVTVCGPQGNSQLPV